MKLLASPTDVLEMSRIRVIYPMPERFSKGKVIRKVQLIFEIERLRIQRAGENLGKS